MLSRRSRAVLAAVRRKAMGLWCGLALLAAGLPALAQLPNVRLNSVFPPGSNAGATDEVVITGTDLDEVDKLIFSHPGVTAEQKKKASELDGAMQPVPNTFVVTVKADVPPGRYDVRAVGRYGVSNPRSFEVLGAGRPQVQEKEPNNALEQAQEVELGSAVSGQSDAAGYDYFKFKATKGQRVIIDCVAQRIDSRLDGTLTLFDAAGNELMIDRDTNRLDPLLDFTAPADGDFIVQLRDFQYLGGADYWYRLVFRTGPYIDFIFPPAGPSGSNNKYTVYGRNLPNGQPAGISVKGMPLSKVEVQIALPADPSLSPDVFLGPQDSALDAISYRLTGPQGVSNAALVYHATGPVTLEQEPNDRSKPQAITAPCEVAGTWDRRADQDWYSFDAKKGDVYVIEAYADRLGRTSDPIVTVYRAAKNEKGEETLTQVATADDLDPKASNIGGVAYNTQTYDPAVKFTAADDGNYRVQVTDQFSTNSADPRNVYRLSIRKETPDFRLIALPWSSTTTANNQPAVAFVGTMMRPGGTEAMLVLAFRRDGFDGPIEINVEGLPPGITARPVAIGQGQVSAPLVFQAADSAKPWAGTIKVTGKSKIGAADVARQARGGTVVWGTVQNQPAGYSRMASDVALAVTGARVMPFSVELGDGKPIATSRGGKVKVPVKVVRRNDFKGAINLNPTNLPTNVTAAKVTIAPDKNDGEIEVVLPANAAVGTFTLTCSTDVEWDYARNPDAVAKAEEAKKALEALVMKLNDEAKKAADSKAANAAELADKAKKADAMAKAAATTAKSMADAAKPKKIKVIDLVSPIMISIAESPLTMKAASAGNLKQGEKVELTINVERLYGFDDAVNLEVTVPGSATGVTAAKVSVPKGQNQGKLELSAAANAAVGEHKLVVKASVSFNGQALTSTQDVSITVEKAEKK